MCVVTSRIWFQKSTVAHKTLEMTGFFHQRETACKNNACAERLQVQVEGAKEETMWLRRRHVRRIGSPSY